MSVGYHGSMTGLQYCGDLHYSLSYLLPLCPTITQLSPRLVAQRYAANGSRRSALLLGQVRCRYWTSTRPSTACRPATACRHISIPATWTSLPIPSLLPPLSHLALVHGICALIIPVSSTRSRSWIGHSTNVPLEFDVALPCRILGWTLL